MSTIRRPVKLAGRWSSEDRPAFATRAVLKGYGGQLAHLAIQHFADQALPSMAAIEEFLKREARDLPESRPVQRSCWLFAATLVNRYFLNFRAPFMRLYGIELYIGRRADLVWELPNHFWLIDEIKTGKDLLPAELDEQLLALYAGGVSAWGRQFLGVRRCELRDPRRSVLFGADGRVIAKGANLWGPVGDAMNQWGKG